jgi:hypothetical protein
MRIPACEESFREESFADHRRWRSREVDGIIIAWPRRMMASS